MAHFRDKFGRAPAKEEHLAFFNLSDSPGSNWFLRLRRLAGKQDRQLKRESGEAVEEGKSEPLLRATHLECCDSLCRMNTGRALVHKAVMVLQRCLGNRASDSAALRWEDIGVDALVPGQERFVVCEWQRKVSEQKPVPLLPGLDNPNLCPMTSLGDLLAAGHGNGACSQDSHVKHHLFPELAASGARASAVITVRVWGCVRL